MTRALPLLPRLFTKRVSTMFILSAEALKSSTRNFLICVRGMSFRFSNLILVGFFLSLEKAKKLQEEAKPRFRKTKQELIDENEKNYMAKKKAPFSLRSTSNGYRTGTSTGFNKRGTGTSFASKRPMDPKKISVNKQFDDIPDGDNRSQAPSSKMPPKPRLKAQTKPEEKPITGKIGTMEIDPLTNKPVDIDRKIEKIHQPKKEVTLKPNFGKFNNQGA